jgi:hypothetical protein
MPSNSSVYFLCTAASNALERLYREEEEEVKCRTNEAQDVKKFLRENRHLLAKELHMSCAPRSESPASSAPQHACLAVTLSLECIDASKPNDGLARFK